MVAKPTVSRIVHYVSFGTPGGEYGKECRAAMVTAVRGAGVDPATGPPTYAVSLCVFNPTGLFFNENVPHDHRHAGGTWHWPEMLFDDQAQVLGMPAAVA